MKYQTLSQSRIAPSGQLAKRIEARADLKGLRIDVTALRPHPAVLADRAVGVAAHGAVAIGESDFKAMRRGIEPAGGPALAPSVLKHFDEQTLAGLAAVYQAVQEHGLGDTDFAAWGALGAPRFLGRAALAHSIRRFVAEGAWGISPHVIPNHTLHSVSGSVSMALQIHGPNFGIDGGPGAVSQALLAAISLLGDRGLPGIWVVATGWDREPLLSMPGSSEAPLRGPEPVCLAVALAVVPNPQGRAALGLRLGVALPAMKREEYSSASALTLEALHATFAAPGSMTDPTSWPFAGGGALNFEPAGIRAEARP